MFKSIHMAGAFLGPVENDGGTSRVRHVRHRRPPCDRATLAQAFIAKAVIGLPMTAMLIERLHD